MTQINFPVATEEGQTFNAPNGVVYTYVGTPPNGYWSGTFQNEGFTTLDGRYLKLDSSNDPVTGGLTVTNGPVQVGDHNDLANSGLYVHGRGVSNDRAINIMSIDGTGAGTIGSTGEANTTNGLMFRAYRGGGTIQFSTGGNDERLRIDAAGNVGIGDTNPGCKLSVAGEFRGGRNTGQYIGIDGDSSANYLRAVSAAGNPKQFVIAADTSSTSLSIGTYGNSEFFIFTNNSERLRIKNTGEVGIGTSDPHYGLDVRNNEGMRITSTSVNSNAVKFYLGGDVNNAQLKTALIADPTGSWGRHDLHFCLDGVSDNANVGLGDSKVVIKNDGKVGIGTTDPQTRLNIAGPSNTALRITDNSSNTYGGITWNDDGNTVSVLAIDADGGNTSSGATNIRIRVDNDEKMRIKSNGYVGINNTDPTSYLTVGSDGDGTRMLELKSARPWVFLQRSTGSSTALNLQCSSNKTFIFSGYGDNGFTDSVSIFTGDTPGLVSHGYLTVNGTKNFRIKHPLPDKTETHDLVHSVIEAPYAGTLYSGMVDLVNGSASVNIDATNNMTQGTFEALNTVHSWSSSNESGYSPVKCSLVGNVLTIECQDAESTDTVYYEVRGVRKDANIVKDPGTNELGELIVEPTTFNPETRDSLGD